MKKKKSKPSVDLKEFHHPDQYEVMKQIVKDGVCPFCRGHLAIYHKEPILWENSDWIITLNDYPYEGSVYHILFICKHHLTKALEVDPNGWANLGEAIGWATRHFKITGNTFFMRSGNTRMNGASVKHLHGHMIVGVKKRKTSKSIKVKVGYCLERG